MVKKYNVDYILLFAVLILVMMGIVAIYSTSYNKEAGVASSIYIKQIIWLVLAFIAYIIVSLINYQKLGQYSGYFYAIIIMILIITLVFGRRVRNIKAWLTFGFFNFQPAELAKIVVIISLAKFLSMRVWLLNKLTDLIFPFLIIIIPAGLILIQPDFGTVLVFIAILFVMLYMGGADPLHLIGFIVVGFIGIAIPLVLTYNQLLPENKSNILIDFLGNSNFVLGSGIAFILTAGIVFFIYYLIFPRYSSILRKIYVSFAVIGIGLILAVMIQGTFKLYQKKRLLMFINPELDPFGAGYHVIQSKIAIGSGGLFGKGFLNSTQGQLGFLPDKSTDFIFSIFGEEFGFLGSLFFILLYFVVLFRGILIILNSKDLFGSLLATGIVTMFFYHFLVNVGMVIGLMPIMGIPLPFLSYGGSHLITCMIGIGILNNLKINQYVH